MYLLDTNVVSDARKNVPWVVGWLRAAEGRTLRLSVVTLGEIMRGIRLKARKDPRAAADLDNWLAILREQHRDAILPITDAIALEWGRLSAERGRGAADALIAATARVHDLILVTRNVADFEDTGVSIINPWDLR